MAPFDPQQERVRKRFVRVIRAAKAAGLVVIADADMMALRLIRESEVFLADDLRGLGETIDLDGGCGGALPRSDGGELECEDCGVGDLGQRWPEYDEPLCYYCYMDRLYGDDNGET